MPFEVQADKPYGWYYRFDQRQETLSGPFVSELAADKAARKAQKRRGGGSWESVLHAPPPQGDTHEVQRLLRGAETLGFGTASNPIEIFERGPLPKGMRLEDL